ncbi:MULTISPECIES: amidohydrolase family protein [unclassified Burkholderia]|uniref:amidohydrolase family protein n=1 Tax=unclassified Burkholderia TaxID=2613784 RepID=UPI0019819F96|nr:MULTISPECIES: amidohydrolase family protein [unclassified Burkholderia]MBN3768435.1 amidohydrolase family protein [Burkholderia sp. Se-20378]MBN3796135.1 amidohydrolase family protein [Burkholderia sp. Ac-20392]
MQVIDPHVHFWSLGTHHYPWLEHPKTSFVGDALLLKHDYLPGDLLSDAGEIEIVKIVHVEANHDPADPVEETRWLQTLADAGDGRAAGWPNGIVAAADLSVPDVEATLAGHAAFANVRGIRQILNVHDNPLYGYVQRHYLRDPVWRKNFGLLARYGLSFDLQLYPSQMDEAAQLARAHPDIQIVLNHAGMFVDRDSPAGYRAWREGLKTLAACPNVAVKISGLAMFDHHWTVESLRPYVLETLDTFGVERAMFASNFPVDRLFGSYDVLWQAYARIVAGASDDERRQLFVANAERIYRI